MIPHDSTWCRMIGRRFRMLERDGALVKRWFAFPQLPWGTIPPASAKVLRSADGRHTLLIDGWYRKLLEDCI
eukprot:9334139-Pyramimonas_sp.AAC.1